MADIKAQFHCFCAHSSISTVLLNSACC